MGWLVALVAVAFIAPLFVMLVAARFVLIGLIGFARYIVIPVVALIVERRRARREPPAPPLRTV